MADLPTPDKTMPLPVDHVDKLVQFDDAPITNSAELKALYLPRPKNLVVIVDRVVNFDDQAILSPDSASTSKAES